MHKKKYLVVCCVDVILWWYTSGGGTYDFMRVHNENFEQNPLSCPHLKLC